MEALCPSNFWPAQQKLLLVQINTKEGSSSAGIFSAFILHCLFEVNQNTTVFEIVTALPVQNNLNENSTIQLIGKIGRDKPVQYLILDSTVRTSLQSKRGWRGDAFNGEYIIVEIVTRIRCKQNLCKICLLVLMTLNNFRLVLCIATLEVTS